MKPCEYRRLLEEHIECSMLEREKRAYRMALAMFLMVELQQGGTKTAPAAEDREPEEGTGETESTPAADEGKAEKGKSKTDATPAAGEGKAEPVIDNAPAQAAGEGKAEEGKSKTDATQAADEGKAEKGKSKTDATPAAGEGKAEPVIDNAPEQAAGEKKKRVYNFKKKKCIKCGNVFTPSYGPQKMCRDCASKIADGKITPTTSDKDSKKEAMIIVDKLLKRM